MKYIPHIFLLALTLILTNGCDPHANYPVTHRVGWITSENINWEVLELSAKFKHQKFNLTNIEGHIIIKAKIKVYSDKSQPYTIKELHINQRYIEEKTTFALIEITPIFRSSRDQETKEEFEVFDLVINEAIQNRNWGRNYYRVKIGSKHVDLKTSQGK
jgi:hypothetical protein